MNKSSLATATGLALLTATISGFSIFIGKIGVTVVKNPLLFTTLKNSVVALILIGLVLAARRWTEIRRLSKKQWLKLVAIGIIGGSVPFALFFTGLSKTSALNGALIQKTLFLWVLLLAIPILKERMTKWQWLGIGLVAAANLFIGGFKGFKLNSGELMILIATILWAVENVIAKITLRDVSSLTVAAARMIFGSIILVAWVSLHGGSSAVQHLSGVQWYWTLLASVLLTGYVLTWYAALKQAPATYVATLLVPSTLVTNALTAVFITHKFPQLQIINSLLIAAGALLLIKFARQPRTAVSDKLSPVGQSTGSR